MYISLLGRKVKNGYSLYLRYYDERKGKVVGSETLNLTVSKNYFTKGEVVKVGNKDKETMRIAEAVLLKRKAEVLEGSFNIILLKKNETKVNVVDEIVKLAESKGGSYRAVSMKLKEYADNNGYNVDEKFINGFYYFLSIYKNKSGKLLAVSTIVNYLTLFGHCLGELKKSGIIDSNPMDNFKMPKSENAKDILYLGEEEIAKIIDADVAPQFELLRKAYLFSCFTGLRRSDVLKLKWSDIKNGCIEITTKKTNSREDLPLSESAQFIINSLEKNSELVFDVEKKYNTYSKKSVKLDTIIQKGMIHLASVTNIKGLHFHSSRHTFGTMLVDAEVDIYTIQKLLTHKDITSTAIYSHLKNPTKRKAVDKLPNIKDIKK